MNFIVIVMRAFYRTLHETHITAQMKLNLHIADGRQIRSDASQMRRTVEQIDRQARAMYGPSVYASAPVPLDAEHTRMSRARSVCVCVKVSTLSCRTSCCPYNKFPLIRFDGVSLVFFCFYYDYYYHFHYCLVFTVYYISS